MLNFTRNKLVGIEQRDRDTLVAHGILDDDIYSVELEVSIGLQDMVILGIEGKFRRWTTPECPKAIPLLQAAVGFRIEDTDFSQKVRKIIGRRACQHFANLLVECCATAQEATSLIRERAQKERKAGRPIVAEEKGGASDQKAETGGEAAERGEKKEPSRTMVIDLHVHTQPASPCSVAPVDQLIIEAKRIGLDGICFTDHNHVWDVAQVEQLRQKHGFLVLRGNEITTDQGDMIVFGLDRDIKGIIKLETLRETVLKAGGFMIAAHPFRGFLTFGVGQLGLTAEKAMERPLFRSVDAVEVLNSKVTDKENSFASEVAALLGLPGTGGSDAHEVSEVGIFATRFSVVIRNESELVEALRGKAYSPIAFRRERGAR